MLHAKQRRVVAGWAQRVQQMLAVIDCPVSRAARLGEQVGAAQKACRNSTP
jgi:hypothetical protein